MVNTCEAMIDLVLYSHERHAWKVADFGISMVETSNQPQITSASGGSSEYRAPELLSQESEQMITYKADVWSMGCILYRLAFRKPTFRDNLSVLNYGRTKIQPEIPHYMDWTLDNEWTRLKMIIYSMLDLNPSKRPVPEHLRNVFTATCVWTVESELAHPIMPPSTETLQAMMYGYEEVPEGTPFRSQVV